jgi:heme O synthase-like polyprenyltransferase
MRTERETQQRPTSGPDLPSLSGVVFGSILFVTGGLLMFTVIGAPAGILLFALGLGWMLTPKDRGR